MRLISSLVNVDAILLKVWSKHFPESKKVALLLIFFSFLFSVIADENIDCEKVKISKAECIDACINTFFYYLSDKANQEVYFFVTIPEKRIKERYSSISLSYEENMTLKEVLEDTCKKLGLKYSVNGRMIFIGEKVFNTTHIQKNKDLDNLNKIILQDVSLPGTTKIKLAPPPEAEEFYEAFKDDPEKLRKLKEQFEGDTYVAAYFLIIENMIMTSKINGQNIKIFADNIEIGSLPVVELKKIPLGDLLSAICECSNLQMEIHSNIITIKPILSDKSSGNTSPVPDKNLPSDKK